MEIHDKYHHSMTTLEEFQEKLLCTSDDQLRISMDEFNVSEKEMDEYMERIRDWYNLQPHLPKDGFETRYIKKLLISNKFNVDKTKRKVDNIISGRTLVPDILGKRNSTMEDVKATMDDFIITIMPKLTENNDRVILWRLNSVDPNLNNITPSLCVAYMLADMRLCMDTNRSEILIYDLKNVRLAHFTSTTPGLLRHCTFAYESYSARCSAVYLFNCPSYLMTTINIITSAFNSKGKQRIFFLKDLDELHQRVRKEYLPLDYGGTYPETSKDISEEWSKAITSQYWIEWFARAEELKSDESKRLGKADLVMDDLLGVNGTFRSLNLD